MQDVVYMLILAVSHTVQHPSEGGHRGRERQEASLGSERRDPVSLFQRWLTHGRVRPAPRHLSLVGNRNLGDVRGSTGPMAPAGQGSLDGSVKFDYGRLVIQGPQVLIAGRHTCSTGNIQSLKHL